MRDNTLISNMIWHQTNGTKTMRLVGFNPAKIVYQHDYGGQRVTLQVGQMYDSY